MKEESLLEKVRKDIYKNRLLQSGDGVVAGISGGADSVCLVKVLKELEPELHLTITGVHVHHGLRGEEADGDQAFVEQLCQELGIPLKTFQVDLHELSRRNKTSLEESGREARYSFFDQVLKETGSDHIAVAHHREDQAETVMLHILRGTGLDGLCGMAIRQGRVIRPLLNVSRAEILKYLEDHRLSHRTDSSNQSDEYTRNRIRNTLFPMISEMFGVNPTTQLLRLSAVAREDRDYLDAAADKAFLDVLLSKSSKSLKSTKASESTDIELSIESLKSLPDSLSKRIIRLAWEKIIGSKKNLEQLHVEQIVNLWENGHTGKKVRLPAGVEAKVSYGSLILSKGEKPSDQPYSYVVRKEGRTVAADANGILETQILPAAEAFMKYGYPGNIKENSLVQLFDFDRLDGEITLRNRREGDRIRPYNLGGDKKLKEYFIDQKVPQELRSWVPVIARGNRVLWIVGMRTSEDYRAGEAAKNVWVLSWSDLQDGGKIDGKNEGTHQQGRNQGKDN